MSPNKLWSALQARLRRGDPEPRHIALQHVMPSDSDLANVQALLDKVGEALTVQFELQAHRGDIVLMDADLASRMSPQLVQAFAEERPLITLSRLDEGQQMMLNVAERFERCQRELLVQLREIPLVRQRAYGGSAAAPSQDAPSQHFDSGFDSRTDADLLAPADMEPPQREVLQRICRGLRMAQAPAFSASFGPGAHMRFDFASRLATVDPLALQQLRVQRDLPWFTEGAKPGPTAQLREIDEMLWDLGLAAGPYRLPDEPADWWHAKLVWTGREGAQRYTRVPRYLELARLLQDTALKPSELRRSARVPLAELRRFLHAALLLGLCRWQPRSPT